VKPIPSGFRTHRNLRSPHVGDLETDGDLETEGAVSALVRASMAPLRTPNERLLRAKHALDLAALRTLWGGGRALARALACAAAPWRGHPQARGAPRSAELRVEGGGPRLLDRRISDSL